MVCDVQLARRVVAEWQAEAAAEAEASQRAAALLSAHYPAGTDAFPSDLQMVRVALRFAFRFELQL